MPALHRDFLAKPRCLHICPERYDMLSEKDLLPAIIPLELADAMLAEARSKAAAPLDQTAPLILTSPVEQTKFVISPAGDGQFRIMMPKDTPHGAPMLHGSAREAALSLALQINAQTRNDPDAQMGIRYFIHAHRPT